MDRHRRKYRPIQSNGINKKKKKLKTAPSMSIPGYEYIIRKYGLGLNNLFKAVMKSGGPRFEINFSIVMSNYSLQRKHFRNVQNPAGKA